MDWVAWGKTKSWLTDNYPCMRELIVVLIKINESLALTFTKSTIVRFNFLRFVTLDLDSFTHFKRTIPATVIYSVTGWCTRRCPGKPFKKILKDRAFPDGEAALLLALSRQMIWAKEEVSSYRLNCEIQASEPMYLQVPHGVRNIPL